MAAAAAATIHARVAMAAKNGSGSPRRRSCRPTNHTGGAHAANSGRRATICSFQSRMDQLYSATKNRAPTSNPWTYTETRVNQRAGSAFHNTP
jgi:hypothetical protein